MVPPAVANEAGATVADAWEYLQHNEWDVAFDILADLDEGWSVTTEWWNLLIEWCPPLKAAGELLFRAKVSSGHSGTSADAPPRATQTSTLRVSGWSASQSWPRAAAEWSGWLR
jgi:hypothetical protein